MARVTLESLPDAIAEVLEKYNEDTIRATHEVVKKVAADGAKAINSSAAGAVGGNKYKRSWTSKSENSRIGASAVIYSKVPGLPHLLEHGHANRNGGRTAGRVHIAPVVDTINESLVRGIEVKL